MALKDRKKLPLFKHHDLDMSKQQIRLLRFSQIRGSIHCEVSVHHIDDAPQYRALSYTWGPPEPAYNIIIEDRTLAVRANLYAFLRKSTKGKGEALRQLVSTPYLWIDQISINQDSVSERNHQVRLMSEIYKRAAVVTIWLGETAGPECDDKPMSLKEYDALWTPESIAELLQDPYFTRLWIVQEVLLNPKIEVQIRGNAELGFDTLLSARFFLRTKLRYFGVSRSTLDLLNRYYTNGPRFGQLRQLHWLIQQFSGNQCADPRDKVYGLVGMCDGVQYIVVDYSKSTQEVYSDVVMAFWTMFRRTRRNAAKVRLPAYYYRNILEGLSREMIVEQHQQIGIGAMLEEMFSKMIVGYFGYDLPIRDMPNVTAVGFKARAMEGQSSSLAGMKPTALDQWWFECSDKRRRIFGCPLDLTRARRRSESI